MIGRLGRFAILQENEVTLTEMKSLVEAVETGLKGEPFVVMHRFTRNGRPLNLALTERLKHSAKKGRVWKSPPFLTAMKNAEYGFDDRRVRSQGGSDGIFLLDRSFRPENEMMRKIFGRYLDKLGSGIEDITNALGVDATELLAVRVVSHHMRLLGVLHRAASEDWLVLVDYDDTK
jgi:hypothetical protein